MTRFTQDCFHVQDNDPVWEIMYQRYNEEYSEAFAEQNKASKVPIQFPVWKQKENCERECNKINKKNLKYEKHIPQMDR